MPTLSSLLVQHGVTSMRVVEEAISRQVLHGGDLATNVLDLGAVQERELTILLAESIGLGPAVGRLRPAAPEVLRTVPAELATRHSVFPLELRSVARSASSGSSAPEETLVIATAEPLAPAVAEDLGFALGVSLLQLAAPLVRIRQALAEHYGVALDRRSVRLLKVLDERGDPGPGATLPADHATPPRSETMPAPAFETAVAARAAMPVSSVEVLVPPPVDDGHLAIDDTPTEEPSSLVEDEESLAAETEPGERHPTSIPPSPIELEDAPTVEAEAYPSEPSPSTVGPESTSQPEEPTPRVETLASHLSQFWPQQDERPGELPSQPEPEEAAEAEALQPEEAALPETESLELEDPTLSGESEEITLSGERDEITLLVERDKITLSGESTETAEPAQSEAPLHAEEPGPQAEAPASQPSAEAAQRPVPGTHALTGWLKRAVLAQRYRHDTIPQIEVPDAAASPDAAVDETAPPQPGAVGRATTRAVSASVGRRKGPFTLAMAEQELSSVDSSEGVLAVLFDFAQQYFEFTLLFTVQGERADVRHAAGPGADREHVTKLAVSLDTPSVLARARTHCAPLVASLANSGVDAELQRDLGREQAPNAEVALLPIVVRGRVVALVYGDDGAASVELQNLGDLVALVGLAAAGLERLILRKKLTRAVMPRASEVGAVLNEAPEARESTTPDSSRATSGPLSARTRAALLEMRSIGEETGAPVKKEPEVGIDAVARAFGLRGTGVDAEVVDPEGSTEPTLDNARTSRPILTPPPAPAVLRASLDPARSTVDPQLHLAADAGARAVFGSAVTAPMLQAVGVLDEIPDLELPVMPAPPPLAELQLDDSVDAFAHRSARPSWPGGAAGPQGSEGREARGAGSSRPQSQRHTPPPPEVMGGSGRGFAERRAGASSMPAGDVRAEYLALVQHVFEGGPAGEKAFSELVRNGEAAISIIAARFPGPLRVDRQRFRELLSGSDAPSGGGAGSDAGTAGRATAASIPLASQCGPILDLIVAIRRPALPFMTVRSSSPDPEVRFWATHVLGELTYPEAANALLPRLFDDSIAVRRIARRSAAALIAASPAGGPILQGLDHITRDREESPARRIVAIETMAEIRSSFMVPALVFALADAHESVVEAAARALVVIARDDFGHDIRKWNAWWVRNGERHRIEWVIDALTHEKPAIRRAASDELKGVTKEYFGYYEDLPRQEREAAQERYRAWWMSEGRSRFRAAGY